MAKSVGNRSRPDRHRPPSLQIVEALADERGDDSTEIEPLYGAYDLEAIDTLVANSRNDLRIEFTVDGYDVTVRGDGTVEFG